MRHAWTAGSSSPTACSFRFIIICLCEDCITPLIAAFWDKASGMKTRNSANYFLTISLHFNDRKDKQGITSLKLTIITTYIRFHRYKHGENICRSAIASVLFPIEEEGCNDGKSTNPKVSMN